METVEKEDEIFKITTNKEIHYSKTIIITAGNGAFQPTKMNVEGEEKFADKNLHYFVTNINEFAGKKVVCLVVGIPQLDWALMLEPIAEKVTLIHRRDKFRAHEHSVELLKQSTVEVLTPYIPIELVGDEKVEKVIIKEAKGDGILEIEADAVLVNYGFVSSLGPIGNWGLEIKPVTSPRET